MDHNNWFLKDRVQGQAFKYVLQSRQTCQTDVNWGIFPCFFLLSLFFF